MSECSDKYTELGGPELGKCLGEFNVESGGKYIEIEDDSHDRISIYCHEDTGAHLVRGLIRRKWLEAGGVKGLGYPTTDEEDAGNDRIGRYNDFQKGSIYYRKGEGGGTYIIGNDILKKWRNHGDVDGLGFPTMDEQVIREDRKGRFVEFAKDRKPDIRSIYYHPSTGAYIVRGSILTEYKNHGWIHKLGYPKSDEEDYVVQGNIVGKVSYFQRGKVICEGGRTYTVYKNIGNPSQSNNRKKVIIVFSIVLGVIWLGLCLYSLFTKNYLFFWTIFPIGAIVGAIAGKVVDYIFRTIKE